jgi:hypothetical protein
MFLVLSEFEVKPGYEQRFERVYGPGGDWDSLFRRDSSHAATYLFRDTVRPRVYLTADYWLSRKSYEEFLQGQRSVPIIRRCIRQFDYKPASLLLPWKLPPHTQFRAQSETSPSARSSGCKNLWGVAAAFSTASAAKYPLRTAPSMVAGQPVAVQSQARNNLGQGLLCGARKASLPGDGENVA